MAAPGSRQLAPGQIELITAAGTVSRDGLAAKDIVLEGEGK